MRPQWPDYFAKIDKINYISSHFSKVYSLFITKSPSKLLKTTPYILNQLKSQPDNINYIIISTIFAYSISIL